MGVIVERKGELSAGELANIETVRRIYRSYLNGDLDALMGALSPNIRIVGTSTDRQPPAYTGNHQGRDQAAAMFEQFRRLVEYQEPLAPVTLTAKANRVLATGADLRRTSSTGDLTEKRMTAHAKWTMIWTFEDGLVSELRVVEDTEVVDL